MCVTFQSFKNIPKTTIVGRLQMDLSVTTCAKKKSRNDLERYEQSTIQCCKNLSDFAPFHGKERKKRYIPNYPAIWRILGLRPKTPHLVASNTSSLATTNRIPPPIITGWQNHHIPSIHPNQSTCQGETSSASSCNTNTSTSEMKMMSSIHLTRPPMMKPGNTNDTDIGPQMMNCQKSTKNTRAVVIWGGQQE